MQTDNVFKRLNCTQKTISTVQQWYKKNITALDSSKMITESRDNSLKIKRDMTESQVNNHWSLSEIWQRIKWTFTEYSKKTGTGIAGKK